MGEVDKDMIMGVLIVFPMEKFLKLGVKDCTLTHARTGNLEVDAFLIPGASCCAMHPTLVKASNITSIENLQISCHFEH